MRDPLASKRAHEGPCSLQMASNSYRIHVCGPHNHRVRQLELRDDLTEKDLPAVIKLLAVLEEIHDRAKAAHRAAFRLRKMAMADDIAAIRRARTLRDYLFWRHPMSLRYLTS